MGRRSKGRTCSGHESVMVMWWGSLAWELQNQCILLVQGEISSWCNGLRCWLLLWETWVHILHVTARKTTEMRDLRRPWQQPIINSMCLRKKREVSHTHHGWLGNPGLKKSTLLLAVLKTLFVTNNKDWWVTTCSWSRTLKMRCEVWEKHQGSKTFVLKPHTRSLIYFALFVQNIKVGVDV